MSFKPGDRVIGIHGSPNLYCHFWGIPGTVLTAQDGSDEHGTVYVRLDQTVEGRLDWYYTPCALRLAEPILPEDI